MIKQTSQHYRSKCPAVLIAVTVGLVGVPWLCAQSDSFEVPQLSSPATGAHLMGKLVWPDLETTDLPGAEAFYHALFAWEFRDYHSYGVDYAVALAQGNPVAGLVRRQLVDETQHGSAWLPFFSVADVDATFNQALKAHAIVRSEPENLPLRGRQARLKDPEGAAFGVLELRPGIGTLQTQGAGLLPRIP